MKNQELFNKTVSILVNAYQNDTLMHGDYCGCAVGNLIAANMGYSFIENPNSCSLMWEGGRGINWFNWQMSCEDGVKQPCGVAKTEIASTGYSPSEILQIERVFERSRNFKLSIDGAMFNSLMAVVDFLMTIHEANETESQEAKSLFVKETA